MANETCLFGSAHQETYVIAGLVLAPANSLYEALMTLLLCYMCFFLAIAANFPQAMAAFELIQAITLSFSKGLDGTTPKPEVALVATRNHQTIQSIVIFVELIIAILFTILICVMNQNTAVAQHFGCVNDIILKILTARVFCSFFVEIFYHEQLLGLILSGDIHNLPLQLKQEFE